MTHNLIRFEFRSGFRLLLVIWGALLAMAVLLSILLTVTGTGSYDYGRLFQDSGSLQLAMSIVNGISWILYIALFTTLVVLTAAVIIGRFYKGLLGDEGYLMHTLPVKVGQLITAKGVAATCAVLGSLIIGTISIVLVVNAGNYAAIPRGIADIGHMIGMEPRIVIVFIEALIIFLASIMSSIYQIYASLSIGQLANRHRILASLGAYIGIGMILAIISGLIIFLASETNIGQNFFMWLSPSEVYVNGGETTINSFGRLQVFMLLIFLGQAIQLSAFHVVTDQMLRRKLNLL